MVYKKEKGEKEKEEKPRKKFDVYEYIKNNGIRKISNFLHDNFDLKNITIRKSYIMIHSLLIFLVSFAFIFSTNIIHLIIVLIVVSLDAFAIVVMHCCPLTILEKKYMKHSSSDLRKECLKNLGISYKCNHVYENQIELLINIWLLIAIKCLTIIFFSVANIKLTNYYGLYQ